MKKYVYKPYSSLFPKLFIEEKKRIASHLQKPVLIEHVGSTAVPGLGGKGIIDIAIGAQKEEIDPISNELQAIGYEFRPTASTPERLFFRIDLLDVEEEVRRYHLHLMSPEWKEWRSFLAFRDYLIAHPDVAKEYGELKKRAALESNEDGAKYRQLKGSIFEKILKSF